MTRDSHEDLQAIRSLAQEVHLPKVVYENVMSKVSGDGMHDRASTTHSFHLVTRRGVIRWGAVAAGVAAAVLGASKVRGVLVPTETQEDGSASAPHDPFTLTAYAKGTEEAPGTVLAVGDFGRRGSLSGGDDGSWSYSASFDLSCTSQGIASLTYTLVGDHVGISEDACTPRIFFEEFSSSETEHSSTRGTSITVGNDAAASPGLSEADGVHLTRTIVACIPQSAELERIDQALASQEAPDTEDHRRSWLEAWAQVELFLARSFADLLSQETLEVEATFTDGASQVQRYAVRPTEDFESSLGSYLEACNEFDLAHWDDSGDDLSEKREQETGGYPSLYTITRLDS